MITNSDTSRRLAHTVFLLYHFIFLILLCNLVLEAPTTGIYIRPPKVAATREYLLLLYSIFSLKPAMATFPFALIVISITASLPNVPLPNTSPHSLLLLALSLLLLQLHLPRPNFLPAPIYLFDPSRSTPIASLVGSLLRKGIMPAINFFAPALFILFVLLSIALGDTFPLMHVLRRVFDPVISDDGGEFKTTNAAMGPSHPQTRLTLLLLFVAAVTATFTLIHALVLIFPSTSAAPSATSESYEHPLVAWDRFGDGIALIAKRSFIKVCIRYANPPAAIGILAHEISIGNPSIDSEVEHAGDVSILAFGPRDKRSVVLPPIINAVGWLLGSFPAAIIKTLLRGEDGRGERVGRMWEEAVRVSFWRVFVAVPGVLVRPIWFWR